MEIESGSSEILALPPPGQPPTVRLQEVPANPVDTAATVIPYAYDDSKRKYLAYRSCGFSPRESIRMCGLTPGCLSNWRREDQVFVDLETRVPEFREKLSSEYVGIEFTRNVRLVMQLDFNILTKALKVKQDGSGDKLPDSEAAMSKFEQDYLLRMRQYYTPQQLQIMQSLMGDHNSNGNGELSWNELAKAVLENTNRVELEVRRAKLIK